MKCVRYPGQIWYLESDTMWTQDQLLPETEEIKYVHVRHLSRYLSATYNITVQQYYNIVVHNDINYVQKCSRDGCDDCVPFYGLARGYLKYCSNSCKNQDRWNDSDYREHMSELGKISMEKLLPKINSDPMVRMKSEITRRGAECPCIFYITKVRNHPEYLKFGITSNPERRYTRGDFYYNIWEYPTSTEIAARLECELKLRLPSDCCDPSKEWVFINRKYTFLKIFIKVLNDFKISKTKFIKSSLYD